MKEKILNLRNYINQSWIKAIKQKRVEKGFNLPYDYISPCIEGDLINLYYWDTYFTNMGLYLDNHSDFVFCTVKCNCRPSICISIFSLPSSTCTKSLSFIN